MYFVPISDCECGSISSFYKWEQAFRTFSKIYTGRYPNKSSELIQYNHIIFTASQTYIWENVYLYDKEFRLHISNYPPCSWAVILQQAWAMYLKDWIKLDSTGSFPRNGNNNPNSKGKKENCRRFNVGKCTAGRSCKFDYRCNECGKWGHGAHICCKKLGSNNSDWFLLLLPNVMEHRSLLIVCFTFTKSPSGPPWNEGHRPKAHHETSVLEVPAQEQR